MGFGKKVKSVASLKKSSQGSKLGGKYRFIGKDSDLTVRFVTEPDEWIEYTEVWDDSIGRGYPLPDDPDIDGYRERNDSSVRFSRKYLANVLITNDEENPEKVIALQMPMSLVKQLTGRYDKYGTIVDRDYELYRTGEGKNGTEYHADPEPKDVRKLAKFEKDCLDLEELLEAMHAEIFTDGDDDEEEEEAPKKRKPKPRKAAASTTRRKRRPEPEEDDEDDEDEEEEEEEEAPAPRKRRRRPEPEPEPEEEEEDEEEEEEDEEDDDEDYYDEAELKAMSVGALRELASDYGVDSKGLKKAELIEALLES